MEQHINKATALIRNSRLYTATKHPYFATALFQCQIHITSEIPIAAIDKDYNIYFNAEAVLQIAEGGGGQHTEITMQRMAFLWLHEISHVIREHFARFEIFGQPQLHELWNIATDLEINDSKWGHTSEPLPFNALFPNRFGLPEGLLAEQYFSELLKSAQQDPNQAQQQKGDAGFGDEGSGAHGQSRPWEKGKGKSGGENGGGGDKKSMSDIDRKITAEAVAKGIAEAAAKEQKDATGKNRGTIPAGWVRWAEALLNPKVDWRKAIRAKVNTLIANGIGGRVDYAYGRPHRRAASHGNIILPRLTGDTIPRICVIVDTSGSMDNDTLAQCIAEVFGILRSFGGEITIIPCDAQAYEPIKAFSLNDREKVLQGLKGGGGTSMVAGINAALQLKPAPDAIVVLTDGYTDYPPNPLATTIVWGILRDSDYQPPKPPETWPRESVVEIDLR